MTDAAAADRAVCVAFAADSVMSKGVAAAVRSVADLAAAHDGSTAIYIVDCGVGARARNRISASVDGSRSRVEWLPVTDDAKSLLHRLSLRSSRPYPPAAYARLLLPSLLPADVERIIYLDADMIVRHDLMPLWSADLDGNVLFAVRDLPLRNGNAERIARTVDQSRIPYPADSVYFQSGLLLMDIAAFRTEDIASRAFEFLAEYPTMQFPDQDALNALLVSRTRLVDPRWNQMSAVYRYPHDAREPSPFDADTLRTLQNDPFIVHFSGRPKPWELGCRHPLVDDWYDAIDRTPWRGWRPNRWNSAISRIPRGLRTVRKRLVRGLTGIGAHDTRTAAPRGASAS